MAVKVEIKESESGIKDFPKLMVSDVGNIVYFSKPKSGTLLRKGVGVTSEGEHRDGWAMENFTDYPHSITLSNE